MNSIIKTFIGKHIDLSKVVAISDARFINRMGFGGYFVGFEIHCQLLDKPIIYERKFDWDESERGDVRAIIYGEDEQTPLAVERLQKQIDELIEQWKQLKES